MLEVIAVAKGWPAHVQPLPILHSHLAISYHAQQNHYKEVHYLLHLCFNSDPVLYPSKVHPTRVCNLFMLTMASHKLAKGISSTNPEVSLKPFELVSIYKYCMMKTAETAQTSHGKQSNLWKALNARLVEEAALVGNPRTVIALMKMDQMQKEYGKLLSQLLSSAGIDPSRARALEA